MNTGMKMLAASMARKRDGSGRYMEYGRQMEGSYARMDDTPEMRRRRDSRGRYMEGGQGNYSYDTPEESNGRDDRMERGGGNRGYPVGNRRMEGRMAEMNTRMHDEGQSPYGGQPEVYRRQEERPEHIYKDNTVNINAWKHKTDPLDQQDGQQRMIGFSAGGESHGKLDKQTAMEWVESMEDDEGVRGGKYTWHQTQQYAMNKGITGEERLIEFYAVMNAMYADYHAVAKKFGVDKPEFYACMAKAFIEDPDAVEGKVLKYYEYITKR